MRLDSEAAIGFLEIFFARAALDAQNLVIIALFGLGRHPRNIDYAAAKSKRSPVTCSQDRAEVDCFSI